MEKWRDNQSVSGLGRARSLQRSRFDEPLRGEERVKGTEEEGRRKRDEQTDGQMKGERA